jgi:hypothetical protein
MKKFELNNLGNEWIYEAETKHQATYLYIKDICGAKTLKEYEEYCDSVAVDSKITWKEIS